MIFATIIICSMVTQADCSEKTGYRAINVDRAFASQNECSVAMMTAVAPAILPNVLRKRDTFRIVCGGRFARLLGKEV